MSWDMKDLKTVIKEGYATPKGHIALTTHTLDAWTGSADKIWERTTHQIPAGTIVMILDVDKDRWGASMAKVFWDGRQVNVPSTERLFMVNPEDKFEKLSFAVTGTLSKQREFYKALIKFKGGVWKNQVSNQTDILVIGKNNRSDNSTKYKKAVRLGKRIISEDDLRQLLRK